MKRTTVSTIPLRSIYGGNEQTIAWANARKLRYSKGKCLHWLKTGRCRDALCRRLSFLDHVTGWVDLKGNRLLLSQPYTLGVDTLAELLEICRKEFLRVSISGDGWYGHGTIALVFRDLEATNTI